MNEEVLFYKLPDDTAYNIIGSKDTVIKVGRSKLMVAYIGHRFEYVKDTNSYKIVKGNNQCVTITYKYLWGNSFMDTKLRHDKLLDRLANNITISPDMKGETFRVMVWDNYTDVWIEAPTDHECTLDEVVSFIVFKTVPEIS